MGVLQFDRLVLCVTAASVVTACVDEAPPFDDSVIAQRSAEVADTFQGVLQTELKTALKNGGPIAAASVCKEAAPAIAQAQSEASGAEVVRVALRNRNPVATVSDEMHPHYDALAKAPIVGGRPATRIWRSRGTDGDRVNFMRAIPMQEQPCALCHGKDVAPDVAKQIRALYPDDLATGFAPGDMRGAIVISWSKSSLAAGD